MNFLKAKWQNIIMANYEISPEYLLPYLPKGVELDYYQNETFVSLVGFLFKDSAIFNVPIPFFGTFEEINLRFYVKRKVGDHIKRGVVFINETVPNKSVAVLANKLYKEHYTCIPTKHKWELTNENKMIEYQWQVNGFWNVIKINASTEKQKMKSGSMEEYIFEHYFGYTKVNNEKSLEYQIKHPSWEINAIKDFSITCDFGCFYGKNFETLNFKKPKSIMLAEGSDISINWKRISF